MSRKILQTSPERAEVARNESSTTEGNGFEMIQKALFYLTLLILPSLFIPLPWGWAEYAKGIFLIFSASLLLTVELIQLFFRGRTSIYKDLLDLSILLILTTFIVSTLFSRDVTTSLYGFDLRIGTGTIAILASAVIVFLCRTFIKTRASFNMMLYTFLAGITLSAFLSILSFFGANLLAPFDTLKHLFVEGYPVTASASTGVGLWGVGFLFSIYFLFSFLTRSNAVELLFAVVALIVNGLALFLFSFLQLSEIPLLLTLSVIALAAVAIYRSAKGRRYSMSGIFALIAMITLLGYALTKVDSIAESVVEDSSRIVQVSLDSQNSWQIVTSTLSDSVSTGLVGMGVDTFSIYYNIKKPVTSQGVDLNAANFTYGGSEVITTLGNRGVIGALVWVFAIVLTIYVLIRDLMALKDDFGGNFEYILFDIVILYLFGLSFLTYFSTILYFVLFMAISIRVLLKGVNEVRMAEFLLIKFDLLVEKIGQQRNTWMPYLLSVIAILVFLVSMLPVYRSLTGTRYALKAENKLAASAKKEERTAEEDVKTIVEVSDLYAQAIGSNPDNTLYRRRRSLLLLDYINLLAPSVNEDEKESEQQQALTREITAAVEIALEESKKATELAPNTFANWDARSLIYTQLVSLGLTNYAGSGVASLDNAIRLNPLNYILYFRGGSVYAVVEEDERAIQALQAGLQINPNHVPSILLAAQIYERNEDLQNALTFYKAAQQVLEAVEQKDSDLYKGVVEKVGELEDKVPTQTESEDEKDDKAEESDDQQDQKSGKN